MAMIMAKAKAGKAGGKAKLSRSAAYSQKKKRKPLDKRQRADQRQVRPFPARYRGFPPAPFDRNVKRCACTFIGGAPYQGVLCFLSLPLTLLSHLAVRLNLYQERVALLAPPCNCFKSSLWCCR